MTIIHKITPLLFSILLIEACAYKAKKVEGWDYNNSNGGFQKVHSYPQEVPPGMVVIERPSEVMNAGDSAIYSKDSTSFLMSTTVETNYQYLAYLKFLKRYYSLSTYTSALPDTTVWVNTTLSDSLKDFLINHYLRDPYYRHFPVVGVSAVQIKRYAKWKTDRINEMILVREGIIESRVPRDSTEVFHTQQYLNGFYGDREIVKLPDLNPSNPEQEKRGRKALGTRVVRMEDGILLPLLRLPDSNEWMIAAHAMGDEKLRYIKTKAYQPSRKVQQDPNFSFLFADKEKCIKEKIVNDTLKPVYCYEQNNYDVYGMNNRPYEIIVTQSGYGLISNGKPATYHKSRPDSLRYTINHNFSFYSIDSTDALPVGFRLAMTYLSDTDQLKRRKGRSYK